MLTWWNSAEPISVSGWKSPRMVYFVMPQLWQRSLTMWNCWSTTRYSASLLRISCSKSMHLKAMISRPAFWIFTLLRPIAPPVTVKTVPSGAWTAYPPLKSKFTGWPVPGHHPFRDTASGIRRLFRLLLLVRSHMFTSSSMKWREPASWTSTMTVARLTTSTCSLTKWTASFTAAMMRSLSRGRNTWWMPNMRNMTMFRPMMSASSRRRCSQVARLT
ncbi:DUF2673 domain-containing protein [Emcibacter nanhaiensis]|uniref:DUF2673 domain-containing protein n=1 Tax=Emcibacter nanhaiensis TaxID=1505037 RepID=A0A501PTY7_9PROT|nr:DUF2673 domain-containing protein [Emcibacter nanhaiensis]